MNTAILTLNIANPSKANAKSLLGWLWTHPVDNWVLTEVGNSPGSKLIGEVITASGYQFQQSLPGGLGVLCVSRTAEFSELDSPHSRIVHGNLAGAKFLGVYGAASDPIRYSSSNQRQVKRDWLREFEPMLPGMDLVIGDLNIADPVHQHKYALTEETELYHRLPLRDAWRVQHPELECTWFDHTGAGCRYDYALISSRIQKFDCQIDHAPRASGFTDHAAVSLSFQLDLN